MNKILILGGAYSQVNAIKKAKELGYYVITCDYAPNNPGHKFSDRYENISTVDKEQILSFAKNQNIKGIIAYASDPAAPTAAYVAEKLKLPGLSKIVADIFCRKDLFRKFQKENNINCPEFVVIDTNQSENDIIIDYIGFPAIVKPVDLSGSRGVKKVEYDYELKEAVKIAMSFSNVKKVIIERYIETDYAQLHGDGIIQDGKIVFLGLGDQRFKNTVPIGSSLPSTIPKYIYDAAEAEVQKVISASGFTSGCINAEVRIDNTIPFVVEIGPRTGGNYVPELEEAAYGISLVELSLRQAMGEAVKYSKPSNVTPTFQYIIGSEKNGRFKRIYCDDYIRPKIKQLFCHKTLGDEVVDYENSNGVVGVAIINFDTVDEMDQTIRNIRKHIRVEVF